MTLTKLLSTLGMPPIPRYSLEEVAHITGLSLRQVRNQIEKGRLAAIKSSARRWAGVLHQDLETYFAAINGGSAQC